MDLQDFIKTRMSKENADILLAMYGEDVTKYLPINLQVGFVPSTVSTNNKCSVQNALEKLAQNAIDLGCDYVSSIGVEAYGPADTNGPGSAYYSGTGLLKKDTHNLGELRD